MFKVRLMVVVEVGLYIYICWLTVDEVFETHCYGLGLRYAV